MHASTYRSAAALLLAAAVGCDAPALPTGPAAPPAASAPVVEEKPMVAGAPGEPLPDDAPPVSDKPRPFDIRDPVKGRRSRDAGGYMGAVANSRFAAEYKMTMINVTQALNLYWAPTGEYPKTHEEFMKEIIEANKIVLPVLSDDREYIYVPEEPDPTKMLQVRAKQAKPAGAPAEAAAPAETPATDQPAAPAEAPAEAAPGEPEGGRDDAGNPLDLRERAAGFGGVSPTDGLAD
jgi:hypothetical protein